MGNDASASGVASGSGRESNISRNSRQSESGSAPAAPRRRRILVNLKQSPRGGSAELSRVGIGIGTDYRGPILVGANPTDPLLYRGSQVREASVEDLAEKWLDPKTGECQLWICEVASPSEFYVHPVGASEDPTEARDRVRSDIAKLGKDLDEFFEAEENRRPIESARLTALDSGHCMYGVARRGETDGADLEAEWERVQILGVAASQDIRRNARLAEQRGKGIRGEDPSDWFRAILRLRFLDYGGTGYKLASDVCAMDRRCKP